MRYFVLSQLVLTLFCTSQAFAQAWQRELSSLPPVAPPRPVPRAYRQTIERIPLATAPVAFQPTPAGAPAEPLPPLQADDDDVGVLFPSESDFQPDASPCSAEPFPVWFGSVSGLVLTRNSPNRVWTTFENNNNPNQLMNTNDADVDWGSGGEVRFGRWFRCRQLGVEVRYWTTEQFTGFSSQTNANLVSTPLILNDIEFAGVNGGAIFDGAAEHRLWRSNELYNVELNLVSGDVPLGWDDDWRVSGLAGVRFFRFDERLVFGSLDAGGTWGGNGGIDEAYLNDRVENDLFGVQVGFRVAKRFWRNLRLFLEPQVGVFNNHIHHRFEAYRGDGAVAAPTVASGVTGTYPVSSSENGVSFLTQIDLGLEWQMTQRWSVQVGYRVLAMTGIALADSQIPTYVVDIPELAAIDNNADLVLHGGFAGLSYNY